MQTEKGNRVIGRQYCRPSFASQRSVGVLGIEEILLHPPGRSIATELLLSLLTTSAYPQQSDSNRQARVRNSMHTRVLRLAFNFQFCLFCCRLGRGAACLAFQEIGQLELQVSRVG